MRKVVTRKAESAEIGICIRFSCRDHLSFKLNSLSPLWLWQCLTLLALGYLGSFKHSKLGKVRKIAKMAKLL